jgi:hypothetical protein
MRYIITETQFEELKNKIVLDIKVGDTLLGGRFKNKKVKVKEIGKNEKGDITINGKPLLKFRIMKESVDNRIIDVLIKLDLPNYPKIYDFLLEIGYNEDEIKEIYFDYFETISDSHLTPSNWMDYFFNIKGLDIRKSDGMIDYIKDGIVVMTRNDEYETFWFDYDLWLFFEMFYGMEYNEIRFFLRDWVEETLNLVMYEIAINEP